MEVTLKGRRKKDKDEAAVEGVRDEQSRQVMRSKAGGEKGLSISHRGSRPELGRAAGMVWDGVGKITGASSKGLMESK